jgi:hypothetical protein
MRGSHRGFLFFFAVERIQSLAMGRLKTEAADSIFHARLAAMPTAAN